VQKLAMKSSKGYHVTLSCTLVLSDWMRTNIQFVTSSSLNWLRGGSSLAAGVSVN